MEKTRGIKFLIESLSCDRVVLTTELFPKSVNKLLTIQVSDDQPGNPDIKGD